MPHRALKAISNIMFIEGVNYYFKTFYYIQKTILLLMGANVVIYVLLNVLVSYV